jgi:DNA polymerase III epsilon subunit-like protein
MFAFVDTETTGLPRGGVQPRIVSIAWMIADNPDRPRIFRHAIIRPDGFTIPAEVVAVHGISTERALAEGRPIAQVLAEFTLDLRTSGALAIVAHNARFDLPIIAAEFERLGSANLCGGLDSHCTMLAARRRWPGESARLGAVYQRIFRKPMQNAHDAAADVFACSQIFFSLGIGASGAAATGSAEEEDWPRLVEAVLAWATERPDFDAGFVESLQEWIASGRDLTGGQKAALQNIVRRWKITA